MVVLRCLVFALALGNFGAQVGAAALTAAVKQPVAERADHEIMPRLRRPVRIAAEAPIREDVRVAGGRA